MLLAVALWAVLIAPTPTHQEACSMANPVIQSKYEKFVQQQLVLKAANQRKERMDAAQGERVREMVQDTKPAPIRIKLIPQLEKQNTFLAPEQAKRLKEVLAAGAVRIIQKFVRVRVPRKYSIRIPKPTTPESALCNEAYAAPLWKNGGVRGYDLVVFVTANNTKNCTEGALAYTVPCMTDLVTGRPVAAGINICPLSQSSSPRRLLNTLVHESVHALGFAGQLFPLYYDTRTWNPYQKIEQIAVEFAPRNKTKAEAMYIAFPLMKALAQKYFSCSALPGTPADVGSKASHFKQRLLGHELMNPSTNEDGALKRITEFTLTLLESTGWYKTRMDLAQPVVFGEKAGCDLAMGSCDAWVEKHPDQNYYCPVNLTDADQCTFDYKGIGVCAEGVDDDCLVAGASILRGVTLSCLSPSTWYTLRHQAFYYHHKQAGGSVGSASSRCYQTEANNPVCFETADGASPNPTCLMRQAMCLETQCTADGTVEASFRFGGSDVITLPCPEGQSIDLAKQLPGQGFTSGKLRCPLKELVCPGLSCGNCLRGVCDNGKCICDMEYTGDNCEISLVPGLTE